MRLTPLTADLLMLLAAAIWGFGFIAQKEAMDAIGPLTFNAVRFGIGALAVEAEALDLVGEDSEGGARLHDRWACSA